MFTNRKLKEQITEMKHSFDVCKTGNWTWCHEHVIDNINRKVEIYNKRKYFWQKSLPDA